MSKLTQAFCGFLLLVSLSVLLFAAPEPGIPALRVPVSSNAVATVKIHGRLLLFSFMGIGPSKSWDAVTTNAFYLDLDWEKWYPVNPVPGPVGRLGASAIGARNTVFLFGGYVVDSQNGGMVVPDVNAFLPITSHWFRGADIPVPVADAVIGLYRDRYVYLIGGRSNSGPVSNVQIFDAAKGTWSKGTPMPGNPVFGHAGGVLDDTIIYVDGAYRNPSAAAPVYLPSDQCWMGKIDHHDPTKIAWSKLPNHPGPARFGIAAGASDSDRKIYFSGGTDNPDSYTGMGFDGKPSEPSSVTFDFNLREGKWEMLDNQTTNSAMNTGGILITDKGLAIAGGLTKGQQVTSRVNLLPDRAKAR